MIDIGLQCQESLNLHLLYLYTKSLKTELRILIRVFFITNNLTDQPVKKVVASYTVVLRIHVWLSHETVIFVYSLRCQNFYYTQLLKKRKLPNQLQRCKAYMQVRAHLAYMQVRAHQTAIAFCYSYIIYIPCMNSVFVIFHN